jgi:prolyl-tRNA editing enzyme YbaK/EbsC (Cys-tRNA(Pro) deacylase)
VAGVAGTLTVHRATQRPDLLAAPVVAALALLPTGSRDEVGVAEIDPALADTAAFCAHYGSPPSASANCVVVSGARRGEIRFLACVVLATTRADVNGAVRRRLDVRKASFAAVDEVARRTGMEYGGITPLGLPAGWPVLVDAAVLDQPEVVVGSGVRRSKIVLPSRLLAATPGALVVAGLAREVEHG